MRQKSAADLAILGLVFIVVLCGPAADVCADVERLGEGRFPRSKLGPDGTMHVTAATAGGVLHYSGQTGSWTNELIPGTQQVSMGIRNQPSLGISPDGALHVVFGPGADFTVPTHGLYYAIDEGSGWSSVDLVADLYTEYLSVETDAAGMPYVIALNVWSTEADEAARTRFGWVTLFLKEAGAWTGPEELPTTETDKKFSTLLRDSEGRLHLALRLSYVHYSQFSEGSWHTVPASGQTFDTILRPPASPAPGDRFSASAPHVTVTDDARIHVVAAMCHSVSGNWQWEHGRYAFNDGTGWSEEHTGEGDGEMVMTGDIQLCSSAVEPAGLVHVFCIDGSGSLYHAEGGPGSWSEKEAVDTGLTVPDDAPVFDAFYDEGSIHAFYQKPDGVYHLFFESEPPPADEPPDGPDVPDAPDALDEARPEGADVSDTALDLDGPDTTDGGSEFGTETTGDCSCRMIID